MRLRSRERPEGASGSTEDAAPSEARRPSSGGAVRCGGGTQRGSCEGGVGDASTAGASETSDEERSERTPPSQLGLWRWCSTPIRNRPFINNQQRTARLFINGRPISIADTELARRCRSSLVVGVDRTPGEGFEPQSFRSLHSLIQIPQSRFSTNGSLRSPCCSSKTPGEGFEPKSDVLAHFVRCARLIGFKSVRASLSRYSLVAVAPRSLLRQRSARRGI